jgi:alkylated DNA repair dioxygenase AlkB
VDWRLIRGWRAGDEQLLPALHQVFTWDGAGRATGWLWLPAGPPVTPWPAPFAGLGPRLLGGLETTLETRFAACCFQAYRDGAGCGWHADRDWGGQAILSLGVTRSLALRRNGSPLETHCRMAHGDLLFMPPGFQDEWEHCVPGEDVPGERCSLVFRTTT